MSENFYFSLNPDRVKLNKIKFGYVSGNRDNLINRLSNSTEQFSDHSYYTDIYVFSKTSNYKLDYREIDKIVSLIARYVNKIQIIEEIYDIELPLMRELSSYLITGNNVNNEFIKIDGIPILQNVLEIEYPKLGLKLEKIYTKDELDKVNNSSIKQVGDQDIENYTKLMILHENVVKKSVKINLWEFQQEALEKIINYFKNNNKCILNWVCRLGKTVLSIKLILSLMPHSVIIGVPSISLLNQWCNNIKKYCGNEYQIIKIGDNSKDLVESSDDKTIYLTTYKSSYKLNLIKCTLKVLDEIHHLTYNVTKKNNNPNTDNKNRAILDIESDYQLGLTATLKISENVNVIGNNSLDVFGKKIDERSLSWAIVNGYICDYEIASPITNIDYIKDTLEELKIETNIDLFVSCLSILELFKSGIHNHILNITNRCEHAKLCEDIINKLIQFPHYREIEDIIQNNTIISETNSSDEKHILNNFRKSPFGIIHCCYKLTEGFDEKCIDSVCLSEEMYSETRIFQSLLRPHTKDKDNNPNKKAIILIPISISDEWEEHQNDNKFKKVFSVLESMSLSDENVYQKLKFINNQSIKKHSTNNNTNIKTEPEIYDESLKLKFINKHMIKGCSFSKLKKIIKLLGGRKHDEITLEEDYIQKTRDINNRLPSLDIVKRELIMKNKTWLDLYSISVNKYIKYDEFKARFSNLYDKDKYKKFQEDDKTLPPYSDLEEMYSFAGYNVDFWYNPIGNDNEF